MRRLLLALLLAPSFASADAISPFTTFNPPPNDCVRGTIPVGAGHGGIPSHCRPAFCETDADCGGEEGACRSMGLCTQSSPSRNGEITRVLAACEEDGASCEYNGTCSVGLRCANEPHPVPPQPERPQIVLPPEAPPRSGCACSASERASDLPLALFALVLVLHKRR
jgi:MYXO-CTERM domain-containing protein